MALVCGDSVIWKPPEKTPLTALAVHKIFERVSERFGAAPVNLNQIVIGSSGRGEQMVADARVPLVSATGSTRMGREIAKVAADRFARTILELGGNNAGIVCPSTDLALVVRAVAFAATETAGQRCTTLRRLIVHASVFEKVVALVKNVFGQMRIRSPLARESMIGPLIDEAAYTAMQCALESAARDSGKVFGGERITGTADSAFYFRLALVEMPSQTDIVKHETFAPILYALKYAMVEEAVALNKNVPQGLPSSIFTSNLREAELFVSDIGSDCGIANVNIGPSGAEIGGAFGGEKETGGDRKIRLGFVEGVHAPRN